MKTLTSRNATDVDDGLRVSQTADDLVGAGFKHEHLSDIMLERPQNVFFEVHAENYMGAGGPPHRALATIRRDYPLSIHGVCMSIGGTSNLDHAHLERFRKVVERYEPAWVSEHLAWSTHDGTFFNDLLPLPYTQSTLAKVCDHIDQVQATIKRRLFLENPSTYVTFVTSTMSEVEFLKAVAERTGCGLLLDVNNVYVSATNHGYSARGYLNEFPLEYVGEIHLAGHNRKIDESGTPLLIDSHDAMIDVAVWELFESVVEKRGAVPTLIEWDSKLPNWTILSAEAEQARQRLGKATLRRFEEAANDA